MNSAWIWSQSMARACKRRFGSNGGEAGQRHGFERPAERFLLPSVCHHFTLHLTISVGPAWSAGTGRVPVSAGHDPVAFPSLEQGPNRSGHAVGKRDGDQLQGLALHHFPKPVVTGRSSASGRDHPHRPEIEQAAEVAVAHFRYLPQLRLAAA